MKNIFHKWLEKLVGKLVEYWDQFWFFEFDLKKIKVFRILLMLTLLVNCLPRLFIADELFGEHSLIPQSQAFEFMPTNLVPVFEWFFWPAQLAFWVHLALVVGIFLILVGVTSRFLKMAVWILNIGFIHRAYPYLFGADVISNLFLLYYCFINDKKTTLVGSVFYRMIQVQLCVIYLFSGFEKLKGSTWWEGTALWTVLANPQMATFDFSFFRHFPLLLAAVSYLTIIFEVFFSALVWQKQWTVFILAVGMLFHLSIAGFLGLYGFALCMICPYILFLSDSDWNYFKTNYLNRLFSFK